MTVSTCEVVQVIAGQAVYDPDELEVEASVEELDESHAAETARCARRIKALNPASVYFSHDSMVWRNHEASDTPTED